MLRLDGIVTLVFALLVWSAAHAQPSSTAFGVASTAAQLRLAFEQRTAHVVIDNHLDLRNLRFVASAAVNQTWVLEAFPEVKSLRGACGRAPGDPLVNPPRSTPGQCVLLVRDDFLTLAGTDRSFWMDNIYVSVAGPRISKSTVLNVTEGSALYLTNSILAGDKNRTRGVDVLSGGKLYSYYTTFINFSRDQEAAVRVFPGGSAAMQMSTFEANTVFADVAQSGKLPAGPVMGLRGEGSDAAQALFHNCYFGNFSSPAEFPADVSVETDDSRVFSTAATAPIIYNAALDVIDDNWLLANASDPDAEGEAPAFAAGTFATPGDAWFAATVQEQSRVSGLPPFPRPSLPDPASLKARDPSPVVSDDSNRNIIIGLVCAVAVVGAAAVATVVCLQRQKCKAARERSQKAAMLTSNNSYQTRGAERHQGFSDSGATGVATHRDAEESFELAGASTGMGGPGGSGSTLVMPPVATVAAPGAGGAGGDLTGITEEGTVGSQASSSRGGLTRR